MEVISDNDYELFINSGQVSESILNGIVSKLINKEVLTMRETSIFMYKTSKINQLIIKHSNDANQ